MPRVFCALHFGAPSSPARCSNVRSKQRVMCLGSYVVIALRLCQAHPFLLTSLGRAAVVDHWCDDRHVERLMTWEGSVSGPFGSQFGEGSATGLEWWISPCSSRFSGWTFPVSSPKYSSSAYPRPNNLRLCAVGAAS